MRAGLSTDLPKRPVREILIAAADVFGEDPSGIRGRYRAAHFLRARQALCLIAFEQGWGGAHIGRCLAGRHHSTIAYAREEAEKRAQREPDYAALIERLRERARPARRELLAA